MAVADPRGPCGEEDCARGKYHVTGFGQSARTVIAASTTGEGAFAVADPRTGWKDGAHQNKLRVTLFDHHVGAITGSSSSGHGFSSGAMAVADPRPAAFVDGRQHYENGGHYGVVAWGEPAMAVTASGQHDNGRWSLADPRETSGEASFRLPAPDDRLVAVIRSLDNTWHRPFTTLELAALQSLVRPGEQFELDGISDSAWRERIGNAVPPDSAQEVGNVILTTLLLAMTGETFMLSNTPIWVRQVAIGLAVDTSPNRIIFDMDGTA
jgi:site-specific DNA-cytosine methylase